MSSYRAPSDDYQFILHSVLKVQDRLEGYDSETTQFMINTAASFAEKELYPLYSDMNDAHQSVNFTMNDGDDFGMVTLPDGFQQVYETFCEAGLQGIVADTNYGDAAIGQPHVVGAVIDEILHSANGDFSLIPTLTHSAYLGIYSHGTEDQKQRYLPDLASGKSSGIMAMTEGSAGSDLSAVRTTATLQSDGSYQLEGQKIYISGGDNHFTNISDKGNIIHVVLAKVKDATSGKVDDRVSMFIVPKIMDDNSNRTRNSVGVIGIEHKMGMAGSATCTMYYKNAWGELIGERGKGIATMFAVMNEARNHVARQALGCAESAYQKAYYYATDEAAGRRMGRAISGAVSPDKPADLIVVHPPVRKLLLRMKSNISGARMLQLDTALQMDLSKSSEDAAAWVSLMTNVVKAHVTELGSQITDDAIQVFGGMGYVEETGVARHYRDVRVTRIYEGTNQIQAVTLLRQMKHLPVFVKRIESYVETATLTPLATNLTEALASVSRVAKTLTAQSPESFTSGAEELLELLAITALAYYHALAAEADDSKRSEAEFYHAHILVNHHSLAKRALAGLETLAIAYRT